LIGSALKPVIKHKHHIVPKYLGGTDSDKNIIELTVEEHAEAHRILYEKYGDIRDKLAYQGLLGIVGKEEIVKKLSGIAKNSKWYYNPDNPSERKMIRENQSIPEGWIKGRGENTWSKNRDYKNFSEDTKKKQSESVKKRWSEGAFENRDYSYRNTKEWKKKNSENAKKTWTKKGKLTCPYCQKSGGYMAMKRWHFDNCKKKFEAGI
jgi:hypothetical protein